MARCRHALEASQVQAIITIGYPPALAAKQGTRLPVVAINAGDPVSTGLFDSLARPGGHLTSISDVSADLTPKRLELLTQLAPGLRRVAMLWNATDLGMTLRYQASEAGAQAMGLRVQPRFSNEPFVFTLPIRLHHAHMMHGYARVSTEGQGVEAQVAALTAAGAVTVYCEVASRAKTDGAQLRNNP